MGRVLRFITALGLIILTISVVRLYRVQSAGDKRPVVIASTRIVPAGTAIQTLIRNKIAESAEVGERITAFVGTPVVSNGATVIPSGTQLEGVLEKISVHGSNAQVILYFDRALIHGRTVPIQTRRVVAMIPVVSDTEILANALRALTGAGLGAALGAVSGDPNLINRGMFQGTVPAVSQEIAVPITVTLVQDLNFSEILP